MSSDIVQRLRKAANDSRYHSCQNDAKFYEELADKIEAQATEIEKRDATIAATDLVIADLSMLVRRLCRRIDKLSIADPIVAQATDYLFRKGLQGSPL